jgi:hypothetical protein
VGEGIGWDAGSVVAYADVQHGTVTLDHDFDRAAGRRELGGVVDQVRHHLRQPHRIGVDPRGRLERAHTQRVAAGVDARPRRLRRDRDHGRDVDALLAQAQLAARHARRVEQVVDQAHEMIDLPLDHREHRRGVRARARLAQDRHGTANRCERIAQLVRQRREEHVLAVVGLELPGFRLLLAGDVHQDVDAAAHAAVGVAQRARVRQGDAARSIRTLHHDLAAVEVPASRSASAIQQSACAIGAPAGLNRRYEPQYRSSRSSRRGVRPHRATAWRLKYVMRPWRSHVYAAAGRISSSARNDVSLADTGASSDNSADIADSETGAQAGAHAEYRIRGASNRCASRRAARCSCTPRHACDCAVCCTAKYRACADPRVGRRPTRPVQACAVLQTLR